MTNTTVGRRPDGPGDEREALAAVSHAIWAHRMRYLFDVSVKCDGGDNDGAVLILPDHAQRWRRQMETDYADLSERERESDREQADKILAVLPAPVAAPEPDWSAAPAWVTAHVFDGAGDGMYIGHDWSDSVPPEPDGVVSWDWTGSKWDYSGLTLPIGVDWRTTLRKRPEVSGE